MLGCASLVSLPVPQAAPPPERAAPSWLGEHDEAVRMARRGDTAAALVILERLQRDHPDDLSVARDHLAIAGWAGQDDDVVRLYHGLPPGPQPDYVIEAAARAY